MKKVISIQPHVIERRGAGDSYPNITSSVTVYLDQLRAAQIVFEGPVGTIAVGRKDAASSLPDPQNPGQLVGIKTGAFFHSNPQRDTLFVSTNLADKTGQRVVWTIPMPSGFQIEDVKLGGSSKPVYLVLHNVADGLDHIYSMEYNGVSTPQPTSITGTKLRWFRSDAGNSGLTCMIENDSRLRVFNAVGNLTDTGVSIDCESPLSIKSAAYSNGVYLGVPAKSAVVFIPQSKLGSLSSGEHRLFQLGTQDVCNLSSDLTGSTVFKLANGSQAGTALGVLNLGPSYSDSTLLVGQPGLDQVTFLDNTPNGLCNVNSKLVLHGPDGFGTMIGEDVNVNYRYSPITRADMVPLGAYSLLEESVTLIPIDQLKVLLAQGGNVTVSMFKGVKIVGSQLGTSSFVQNEADNLGAPATNNLVMIIPEDPTKRAINIAFSDTVEGVKSQFVNLVEAISHGEEVPAVTAAPLPTITQPTDTSSTSRPTSTSKAITPTLSSSFFPISNGSLLTTVTSVVVGITSSALQQITNGTDAENSSSSGSRGVLSLPYLLLVVGVGIIILVLLVIAAKVTHRTNTIRNQSPRELEGGRPLKPIENPVYIMREDDSHYEEIGDNGPPALPTSARPGQQGDNPYLLPTPLKKVVPVSNPTYDIAMQESQLYQESELYDARTLQGALEDPVYYAATNTEYADVVSGGYLRVEPADK